MGNNNTLINLSTLNEMLYGEQAYIKEFADAAVISFGEFKENYCQFLVNRDEVNFRKAGHKIKPVAQMLGLGMIIEEYEQAKGLLWDDKPDSELKKSCIYISDICDKVLKELSDISK